MESESGGPREKEVEGGKWLTPNLSNQPDTQGPQRPGNLPPPQPIPVPQPHLFFPPPGTPRPRGSVLAPPSLLTLNPTCWANICPRNRAAGRAGTEGRVSWGRGCLGSSLAPAKPWRRQTRKERRGQKFRKHYLCAQCLGSACTHSLV